MTVRQLKAGNLAKKLNIRIKGQVYKGRLSFNAFIHRWSNRHLLIINHPAKLRYFLIFLLTN